MECHCIYVESAHNVLANALSKLDFHTFRKFKPGAFQYMTLPAEIQY